MLLRLLCLGILLLTPRLCLALDPWEEAPGGCRLDSWSDVERWRDWNRQSPRAANWAEEKSRYGNNREVWRWHDRLYISILDGKVLTLADCSFSDDTHYYEYARYDEPGGFHVVHVWRYEAHGYALVMRNTGKIYSIAGLPYGQPITRGLRTPSALRQMARQIRAMRRSASSASWTIVRRWKPKWRCPAMLKIANSIGMTTRR